MPLPARRRRIAVVAAAALVPAVAAQAAGTAGAAPPPVGDGVGGAKLTRIGSFDTPVYVTKAPGFRRLLFVVEQNGTVSVLRRGRKLSRKFLDIRGRVQGPAEGGGEQGLLSIAFAPNYRTSRRFYVYYTNNDGDNQVDEFKRRRDTAVRARHSSRRRVIPLPHPTHANHNGGQLQFGPDERLYIATGDGGGGGDPAGNAQSKSSLLGKLLRINPLPGRDRGYRIPSSNPFVGRSGRNEIYSLGLRNPWRFSFDRRSGRISIGDVGQGSWEEVDYETRTGANGANFGWNRFEGNHPYPPLSTQTPPPHYEPPIHEYAHAAGRCNSVTGGYVVRDTRLTSLYGRYLYADLCAAELRSFIPRLDGARDDKALNPARPGGTPSFGISSFGEGRLGRVFVVYLDGPVYRLDPS